MTKILAFAEQRNGAFKKSSFETVYAARTLAAQLGGEVVALVVGFGVGAMAGELAQYGAGRILVVDQPEFVRHASGAIAGPVAQAARREGAGVVLMAASQLGKDIARRVAVRLGAGLAADCVALTVEGSEIRATRPVYAGKALEEADSEFSGMARVTSFPHALEPSWWPRDASGCAASARRRKSWRARITIGSWKS